LWDALSSASGKDVGKVMSIWTSKVGHPIVKVTETADGIQLQQNRFLQTADVKPEEDETIYPIMTSLITGEDTAEDIQFNTRTLDIPLKSHEFFKLNKGSNGLYVTLYTTERLLKLGEAIKAGLLSVEDRIGMVYDSTVLAASGYQKTSSLLGLLSTMSSETSANAWMSILANLRKFEQAFQFKSEAIAEGLDNFKRNLTAPRAHQLGWEIAPREDMLVVQNKVDMFAAAGRSGDEK
jgi:aminopeptidase 2